MPRHTYTESDLTAFMEMWNQYQTTESIAKALGRSPKSVIQKSYKLGLKRDYHTVRMVSVYGADILKHGLTPDAIKKAMLAAKQKDQALKLKTAKKKQRKAIADFRNNIRRHGRLAAMKIATTELSLSKIGEIMGVSKQAISKRLKRET